MSDLTNHGEYTPVTIRAESRGDRMTYSLINMLERAPRSYLNIGGRRTLVATPPYITDEDVRRIIRLLEAEALNEQFRAET